MYTWPVPSHFPTWTHSCRGCVKEADHEKVLADLTAYEDQRLGGYRSAHLPTHVVHLCYVHTYVRINAGMHSATVRCMDRVPTAALVICTDKCAPVHASAGNVQFWVSRLQCSFSTSSCCWCCTVRTYIHTHVRMHAHTVHRCHHLNSLQIAYIICMLQWERGWERHLCFYIIYVLWCLHRNTSTLCDVKQCTSMHVRMYTYIHTYVHHCWWFIGLLCCLVFSDEYTHEMMARTTTQSSLNKRVHLCARAQLLLEQGRRKSSECLLTYLRISLGCNVCKPLSSAEWLYLRRPLSASVFFLTIGTHAHCLLHKQNG